MAPRTTQGRPKGPQGLKNHCATSIFSDCVWCSDVICHVIFARDSLAAFQASQDQTKIAIVAPSFQSIRLHISQAEYPEPPNTFERKRDSGSFFQARWRGWPAGQLCIYVYNIYIYIYIYIGVRDLPLRDMISLDAWRMGLGCSGEILPSSPPSSSPTRG